VALFRRNSQSATPEPISTIETHRLARKLARHQRAKRLKLRGVSA